MRAKKVTIEVIKRLIHSTYVNYQCPKCFKYVTDYSFDYDKIIRFKCNCGQEIIAQYKHSTLKQE
jgi:predicted RNA-binding Zn-ribbon protein involved in translation (DUF1610 family)